tara:strand:+ start:312 stop:785 length:474 start_codon:yes stop_codon:yes gene_type:complete
MNNTLKVTTMLDGEDILYDNKYIYSLYRNDVCVYVGQTKDLRSRVYAHLCDRKNFNRVDYFICPNDDANEMESMEIVSKQPEIKGHLPPNKSYKLMTTLSKEINEILTKEFELFDIVYECGDNEKTKRYISSDISTSIKISIKELAESSKLAALKEE